MLVFALTACAMTACNLTGCSMAPPLKIPEVNVATGYKESGPWVNAQPADEFSRGDWWKLYNDQQLDALEQKLIANSPDLAAAVAHYMQAEAVSKQLNAQLLPQVNAVAGAQRNDLSDRRPLRNSTSGSYYNDFTLGLQASYEVDLWGRVHDLVASGKATAQAEQANLESVRLSLQAELAQQYIALRGLDQQIALLRDTVVAYRKTLELTTARYDGGIAPRLDVARARTQYETAQSQVEQALAQRALTEHAIAALLGESASNFSIAASADVITIPAIPVGVPSALLQRRPDIAAAQRTVAAANASVGVAKTAFFPSLTLGGALGFESSSLSTLIAAPSTFWAIGPSALLTLFDSGKRKAQVEQAQSVLDESGAKYRSVVIAAFQQVEDNLALLNHYQSAAASQQSAVTAAKQALDYSSSRYKEGASSYLDVTASQTDALQTQRDLLTLETLRLHASVDLIRALGGGWQTHS